MSDIKFTPEQQDAIDASGGSILVSAAAGSGKTRVLVSRVIKRVTDPENPIPADRMLIMTYTKTAAAEMKARIASAIEKLLISDPENTNLKRQQILLPRADISTIHSFCSKIIRENFYLLDISRDFRIGEDTEMSVIKHRLISDIIEESYSSGDDSFRLLSEIVSGTKNDRELEKTLILLYEKAIAHPFPEDWLDDITAMYDPSVSLNDTFFARLSTDKLKLSLNFAYSQLQSAWEIIDFYPDFQKDTKTSAKNAWLSYNEILNKVLEAVSANDTAKISEIFGAYTKPSYRKPTGKNVSVEDSECERVRGYFDSINEIFTGELSELFKFTEDLYKSDTEQLYPVVCCLCQKVKEFSARYFEIKNERNVFDFSDLEHLMLKLLVEKTDKGIKRTEFAKELSECYDEIMIDEYQDTNEIQEMIFRAVSKNENNMFVVGDVKQSIFRFREAVPQIFTQRREGCTLYRRKDPHFPAKIILDKNFRSREGIIDSVNFVFERIMSKRVGEIDYNEEEKLTFGAKSYPQTEEPQMELHILENKSVYSSDENEELENISMYQLEANHIVNIINDMINRKVEINDNGVQRPVTYGDFCILMRTLSGHSAIYSNTLNKSGIPAYTDKPYSLFGCYEVNTALSFLKAVDNPLNDIPMLSIMLCSIFGFTAEELAELKIYSTNKHIYGRIIEYIKDTSADKKSILYKKCEKFVETLTYFRSLAVTVSTERLLDLFFEKMGFMSVMGAMKNGSLRIKNLRKLMHFIRNCENSGRSGLTSFIRHINYLEENGTEITAADTAPTNSVKIMTIHHSKGLEFPICILAATNAKGKNNTDSILCHSELGLGINTIDRKNMLKFPSFQRTIICSELARESRSEEMRVLYVAMTRPREKLIVLFTLKPTAKTDYGMTLKKIAQKMTLEGERISAYSAENASTLAEWIIMCAMVHPTMQALREDAGIDDIRPIPSRAVWKYVHAADKENDFVQEEQEEHIPQSDPELLKLLEERFSQTYKHKPRTLVPSKVSASNLAHKNTEKDFVAVSVPSFALKKKITGADRGTATHKLLQLADFGILAKNPEEEKQRLVDLGYMRKEEATAIRESDVSSFVNSELFRRMINAEKLHKEYRFTVNISAKEVDEETECEDNVILQGAIDCLIEETDGIVIVDYKTDKVKDISELAESYRKQLQLYKNAAEQLIDKPVKECIIYSLYLGEQITV